MKRFILGLLLALMVGCASLTTPLSFDQRIAYALAQNTAARQTCTDLVDRSRMDAAEGQQCMDFTDEVRAAIEAAKAMGAEAGADQLRAVQMALLRLEAYLQARQKS